MEITEGLYTEDLSFSWHDKKGIEHKVLEDLSIHISPREFVTIVGKSGTGKTTLLHALAGITKPTSGAVYFNGEEVKKPMADIGMVFQDYSLFPWLNVMDNIKFAMKHLGLSKKEKEDRIEELLQVSKLGRVQKKYPHELSGGMCQRIAVIRAIANNSDYILMDEPFGALDFGTRKAMQDFLMSIWREFNKSIVFVTHNIDEAIILADKVIVLNGNEAPDIISLNRKKSGNPKSREYRRVKDLITDKLV